MSFPQCDRPGISCPGATRNEREARSLFASLPSPLTLPEEAVWPFLGTTPVPGTQKERQSDGSGSTALAWRLLRWEQSSAGSGNPSRPPRVAFGQSIPCPGKSAPDLQAVDAAKGMTGVCADRPDRLISPTRLCSDNSLERRAAFSSFCDGASALRAWRCDEPAKRRIIREAAQERPDCPGSDGGLRTSMITHAYQSGARRFFVNP